MLYNVIRFGKKHRPSAKCDKMIGNSYKGVMDSGQSQNPEKNARSQSQRMGLQVTPLQLVFWAREGVVVSLDWEGVTEKIKKKLTSD